MARDTAAQHADGWDRLHRSTRFRPLYPSEPVVRFVARRYGGIPDPVAPGEAHDLLDIGCGAGRHTHMMASAGHRVVATDISTVGLEHTRVRLAGSGLDASLCHANMTALPLADESVDGAVAYGVFLYSNGDEFERAILEAHRVLRPGGSLLAVVRSTRDARFALGERLDESTVLITDNATNEAGTIMHFVDPVSARERFDVFSDVVIDHIDFSVGGKFLNADLIVEARK